MKIVRHHQQGVVLFVALIVLIIMTLAGLALLRQMGAGTSIAGNIAFKENATSVADRGTEVARKWIRDNTAITANELTWPETWPETWLGPIDGMVTAVERLCGSRRAALQASLGRIQVAVMWDHDQDYCFLITDVATSAAGNAWFRTFATAVARGVLAG